MRKYLKGLRERANMTQEELAKKLGITRTYYLRIENGERQQKMSVLLALKLAEALDVSVDYILEHETKAS